jgi:hypothetical protein
MLRTTTYQQIHKTLRRLRGPASDHLCSCGTRAYEWAYQFTAGDKELRNADGSGPHSLNPDDYAPMCRPCHSRLDNEHDERMHSLIQQGPAVREEKYKADPELLERVREAQRKSAQRTRRCLECGWVSSPGGIGNHQKSSGHQGWTQEEGELR